MSHVISRYLAPFYLLLCLLLGGASAAGFLANGVIQLIGLLLILFVVLNDRVPALERPARMLLLLIGAAAALLVLESIPLPAFLWRILPGHGAAAQGYELVGMAAPWQPLSLAPDGTLGALTALIPAFTMVVLIYAASGYGRTYCAYALVLAAVASIGLGVLQKMQGPDSPYYLYDITNRGGVVGFFANRNHLATLLLTVLPFLGALAISPSKKLDTDRKLGRRMIAGCTLLFVAIGVVIIKSVAGWMLLSPVLFAVVIIFLRGEQGKVSPALLQVAALVGVAGVLLAAFAPIQMNDLGDKLSGIDPHMRNMSISTTLRAALDYLPFGSGGGSFTHIFPQYEAPEAAQLEYLNHAHNDYVEIILEHGIAGLALIGAALALWGSRAKALWGRGRGDALGRAGFVAIGVLFAHSLVDYPARTAAMAAVAGLAAALMVAPPSSEMPTWQSTRKRRRRRGESNRTINISLVDS